MRAAEALTEEQDDLVEMANLSPSLTGLPMIVWISERGRPSIRASSTSYAAGSTSTAKSS
jgi:hypothetical protein